MTGESRRAGVSAERVAAVLAEALHQDGNPAATPGLTCAECRRTAKIAAETLAAADLLAPTAVAVAAALDQPLREAVEALRSKYIHRPDDRFEGRWVAEDLRILAPQPTADGSDQ